MTRRTLVPPKLAGTGRMTGMTGRRPAPVPQAGAVRVPTAVAEVVGFTVLAHVAAGGVTPGTGHLAAVASVVALLAVALRRRLVRLPVAVAGTVVAQVGLHAAFVHAAAAPLHPEHEGHNTVLPLSAGMLLAHAAAAVVTTLALAWQEQVVVRLAALLLPDLAATPAVRLARGAAPAVPPLLRASLLHAAAAPRRGPPVPA